MLKSIITFGFILLISSEAKIFNHVEIAHTLYENGITDITRWLCMIKELSAFNSTYYHVNENNESGNGIFSIYHPFWCGTNEAGGKCNINCVKLRDDDLHDDIECVKFILKDSGIEKGWPNAFEKCKDNPLNILPDYLWDRRQNFDDPIWTEWREKNSASSTVSTNS